MTVSPRHANLAKRPGWVFLLVTAVVFAGCSSDKQSSQASTTTTGAAASTASLAGGTTATSAQSATSPLKVKCQPVGNLEPKTRRWSNATGADLSELYGKIVSLDDQDCYERFTLEFYGSGSLPGWQVVYQPPPIKKSPSDQVVAVAGQAFLVVTVGTWMYPEPNHAGPSTVAIRDMEVFKDVQLTQNFESVTTWVIGLKEQRPFVVHEEPSPFRLVIDVTDTA